MTSQVPVKFKAYESTNIPRNEVEPLIQMAVDEGSNYTTDEIFAELSQAKMQLWTCETDKIEAAMVTALHNDYCLLLVVGGKKMDIWKNWLPIVEDWARSKDCKEMRIYGRRGWSRILGYTVDYTKMVKVL